MNPRLCQTCNPLFQPSSILWHFSYISLDPASKLLLLTWVESSFTSHGLPALVWVCWCTHGKEICHHLLKQLMRDLFYFQQVTETTSPSVLPPSALSLDLLNNAVTAFSTLEELIRYLEPDRWQMDLDSLYKPPWQVVGKAFLYGKKNKGKLPL